jgi:hypothetical protein
MSSVEVEPNPAVPFGVGIDTARYGHSAHFLSEDRQPALKPLDFTESSEGYAKLRAAFERVVAREPRAHFHIRVDAAGQYATNLERFLRGLPWPKTVSIGEPERNKRYRQAICPKRKADATDSFAAARFAIAERPAETPDVPVEFYQLREVVSRLESQVRQTTRHVNQLHNLMARAFPELATIVSDLAAGYVLALLGKYPTAQKIAQAKLASLTTIPHLSEAKATEIQKAAKDSVASLRGSVPEGLVAQLVAQIKASLASEKSLEKLMLEGYQALPPGPHRQIKTIKGIGHDRGRDRGQGRVHRPLRVGRKIGRLFRGLPRREQLRRGQTRQALPAGHDGDVAQGERPGPPLPLHGLLVWLPAQPGTPCVVRAPKSPRQEERRCLWTLHAEDAAPGLRRVEDRPTVRSQPLPLGKARSGEKRRNSRGPQPGCARRASGHRG